MALSRGFSGEVATYYARHRRGYPAEVVDAIVDELELGHTDGVLDLGCGTGQLTLPLAARVGTVIGMDPEPDMLAQARQAAERQGIGNITWRQGTDRSLVEEATGLGLAALTVAVAIHWMDRDALFPAARRLLRPGGGVAVVTNGAPLWLQDTDWSRSVRGVLEDWTGRPHTGTCQTDVTGRALTSDALRRAGFQVAERTVAYDAPLSVDDVIGGIFSAMSGDRLPAATSRAGFADRVRAALAPHVPITERVTVWLQLGR